MKKTIKIGILVATLLLLILPIVIADEFDDLITELDNSLKQDAESLAIDYIKINSLPDAQKVLSDVYPKAEADRVYKELLNQYGQKEATTQEQDTDKTKEQKDTKVQAAQASVIPEFITKNITTKNIFSKKGGIVLGIIVALALSGFGLKKAINAYSRKRQAQYLPPVSGPIPNWKTAVSAEKAAAKDAQQREAQPEIPKDKVVVSIEEIGKVLNEMAAAAGGLEYTETSSSG